MVSAAGSEQTIDVGELSEAARRRIDLIRAERRTYDLTRAEREASAVRHAFPSDLTFLRGAALKLGASRLRAATEAAALAGLIAFLIAIAALCGFAPLPTVPAV